MQVARIKVGLTSMHTRETLVFLMKINKLHSHSLNFNLTIFFLFLELNNLCIYFNKKINLNIYIIIYISEIKRI